MGSSVLPTQEGRRHPARYHALWSGSSSRRLFSSLSSRAYGAGNWRCAFNPHGSAGHPWLCSVWIARASCTLSGGCTWGYLAASGSLCRGSSGRGGGACSGGRPLCGRGVSRSAVVRREGILEVRGGIVKFLIFKRKNDPLRRSVT